MDPKNLEKLQPGMIEFSLLPVAAVGGALRAVGQNRKLRKGWRNVMTAGHLAQAQAYGGAMARRNDPVANWVARRFAE